jgi:hypothetical protein
MGIAKVRSDSLMEVLERRTANEVDREEVGNVCLLLWAASGEANRSYFVQDAALDGAERLLK